MKTFLRKLEWVARRRRREAELRDELECHLAEEADERHASGLTEEEARFPARRDLGSLALIKEDTRSTWGWIWIERIGQDARYAVRMMQRKPGFALAAICTLMLGIGGNTAMFGLMNALLMRSLPVDRPEELVRLIEEGRDPSAPRDAFTLVTQDTLQGHARALTGVLASSMVGARPLRLTSAARSSRSFFNSCQITTLTYWVFAHLEGAHLPSRIRARRENRSP